MWEYDSLSHHGIMGMRWGVRRFQHPDGSRTSLGRKKERVSNREDHAKENNRMETGTKVALAAVSIAAVGTLVYVGKKKVRELMFKGAEDSYNGLRPIRNRLPTNKQFRETILREYMEHKKERFDMGKMYFIKQGFKVR